MIREIKDNFSYSRVISFLSVFAFIFGTAVCFVGEVFLPFASAFLSALFLFEDPKKRIFSYLCPGASIIFASALIGPIALIGAGYVLLALIIFTCYKKSISKSETAIYLTLAVVAFMVLSLYLRGAILTENYSLEAVIEYYKNAYRSLRKEFITLLSEFTVTAKNGVSENLMSVEDATLAVNAMTNSFVSAIVIFAFLLTGIAEKVFSAIVLRYSKHGILKTFAHFIPTSISAYAYAVCVFLSIFSSDSTDFGIALANVTNILLAVFLYMGCKYLVMLAKASPRKILIFAIIIISFISFTLTAVKIASYLGAWVVIGTNSHNKKASE